MTNYLLTHEFAIDKNKYNVKFESYISVTYLSNIIAYIQFLTDEIKHSSELSAIEIVSVLKMFYDDTILILNNNHECDFIIDEYENWEFYCGTANQLLNDPMYKCKGLREFIIKILDNQEMLLNTQQ